MTTLKTALQNSALFKRLSDSDLEQVIALSHQESYTEGQVVFSEGTPSEDMYIVINGIIAMEIRLAVYPGMLQKATAEVLKHGDTFGWSSVLGSHVYVMTATAIEPTEAVVIDGESLYKLLTNNPEMGYKVLLGLIEVVSSRVWGIKRAMFA